MLEASVIFPALSYTRLLVTPLQVIPFQLMNIVQALISWGRMSSFLRADECDESPSSIDTTRSSTGFNDMSNESNISRRTTERSSESSSSASVQDGFKTDIEIWDGTFRWDVREKAALQDAAVAAEMKKKKGSTIASSKTTAAENIRSLSPGKELKPFFKDLDLRILRGALTAVVGPVGKFAFFNVCLTNPFL